MSRLRHYRILGCGLEVASADEDLAISVEGPLNHWLVDRSAEAPLRIQLALAGASNFKPDLSPLRVFWSGTLADGSAMRCLTGPGVRVVEITGRLTTHIDLEAGRASIIAGEAWQQVIVPHGLAPALAELLRSRGVFLLHAACVAPAPGRAAMLIVGPSGTGKTTTALALAGAGMELLADDSTFYRPADGAVAGLPLACKVHSNTRAMLPWLGDMQARTDTPGDEVRIDACDRPAWALANGAKVASLVFLEGPNGKAHVIKPLDETQAVARLAAENVRALDNAREGPAAHTFAALCRLAGSCRRLSLSAGPDLQALAPLLAAHIEGPA